ncbi:MAG: helix-turn-helix domain-containing protein [Bacteroidales bacterium]|nr:helix-turn-helix domain-containing protein [Bacteroidales bacterium]
MQNPFEEIDARLFKIEALLLEMKHKPVLPGPQPDHDKLFSIEEAANFLKLSVSTVYSKVSKGELPSMKRDKRLYFSKLDLLNYIRQGKRKTLSDTAREAKIYCSTKNEVGHGKS